MPEFDIAKNKVLELRQLVKMRGEGTKVKKEVDLPASVCERGGAVKKDFLKNPADFIKNNIEIKVILDAEKGNESLKIINEVPKETVALAANVHGGLLKSTVDIETLNCSMDFIKDVKTRIEVETQILKRA
jgi:hypothetical protein